MADSIKKIDGVEDVELYNTTTALYKVHPQDDWKQGVVYMKADPENQKYDIIQLREGRWPGKDDIGIERLTSQYLKVDIGDSVTFKIGKTERTLPITGKIRHPFVPPPNFGGPAYFFINGAGMERFGIPEGKFGAMLIRVKPYSVEHAKEVAYGDQGSPGQTGHWRSRDVLPGPEQALGPHVCRRHHAGHAGVGRHLARRRASC